MDEGTELYFSDFIEAHYKKTAEQAAIEAAIEAGFIDALLAADAEVEIDDAEVSDCDEMGDGPVKNDPIVNSTLQQFLDNGQNQGIEGTTARRQLDYIPAAEASMTQSFFSK